MDGGAGRRVRNGDPGPERLCGAALWKRNLGENLEKMVTPDHNRSGEHSVETFDWLQFLEFAGKHLQRP